MHQTIEDLQVLDLFSEELVTVDEAKDMQKSAYIQARTASIKVEESESESESESETDDEVSKPRPQTNENE